MKQIGIIFIQLFICFNLSAQVTLEWEFDNNDAYNYYPTTNIIRVGEFTYVSSQSIDVLKTAYVFKLDSNGQSIYSDSIHNFDYSILKSKRMITDSQGSIYLCGNSLDSLQYSKIRVIKYDSQLNRQWEKVLVDTVNNDYNVSAILFSSVDNKIYIVGSEYDGNDRPIVIKIDTDGNTLWKYKDTLHTAFYFNTYVVDHSGNLFIGGNAFVSGGAEDLVVSKIDSSGINLWMANIDGSNHSDDAVMDLCVNVFNEICVSGRFEDSIPHRVLKYNQSGNLIWSSPIPDISLEKIATDPSGNVYVVGFDSVFNHEYVIYKYDSAGMLIDTAFLDLPIYKAHNIDYWVSIQTDDASNVYLLNNVDTLSETRWFVAKLNSSLDTLWTMIYPGNIPNPSTASTLVPFEGGFVIAGAINNFGQLRVLQFHETFTTGIADNNSKLNFKYWPNPTINTLNIELEKSVTGNLNFELYDINSKIVLDKYFELFGDKNFAIDLNSISAGMYFFKLQSEDQFYSGKMVIVDNF
jgi:hypothetical protein